MQKILLLFLSLQIVNLIIAQDHKFRASAHVSLSVPTYKEIPSMGAGIGTTGEFAINKKWATLFSVDFHNFYGKVIDHFNQDTIKGFSILPIMGGIKYYSKEKYYIGAQGGIVIGLKHAGNCPALSASTGMLVPLKNGHKVDIGLNFTAALSQVSIPENNFLDRGGYNFLSGSIGFFF
jgi:hypothetical protein